MVSCQKGPTRHAYAWQIEPFWQNTLELYVAFLQLFKCTACVWITLVWLLNKYILEMILHELKGNYRHNHNSSIKCGEHVHGLFLVVPQFLRRFLFDNMWAWGIAWLGIGFSHWWSTSVTSQNVPCSLCSKFAWHLWFGYCVSDNASRTICGNGPFLSQQYFSYYNKSWSRNQRNKLYILMHQEYFICLYNMIKGFFVDGTHSDL